MGRQIDRVVAGHVPRMRGMLLPLLLVAALVFSGSARATDTPEQPDPALRALLLDTISNSDSFEDRFDAEVWLVSMSARLQPFITDPAERLDFLRQVHKYARAHSLQPSLVLAVIEVESHFDRYAVSHAGAMGVMQIMPFWKNEIGRPDDNLIDLETNLQYGVTILRHYLNKEQGRWPEALARYNGSLGSYRYAIKVMDAWEKRWK